MGNRIGQTQAISHTSIRRFAMMSDRADVRCRGDSFAYTVARLSYIRWHLIEITENVDPDLTHQLPNCGLSKTKICCQGKMPESSSSGRVLRMFAFSIDLWRHFGAIIHPWPRVFWKRNSGRAFGWSQISGTRSTNHARSERATFPETLGSQKRF